MNTTNRLFALVLLVLLVGQGMHSAPRSTTPFKISFEEEGKKVATNLKLRFQHQGKITEISYIPGRPLAFPKLKPLEQFDLWIITDKYTLPFLNMPANALEVAGWRVGIDARPFHLEYVELNVLPAEVRVVYYMIYKHANGDETPILFESSKSLEEFRNPTAPRNKR